MIFCVGFFSWHPWGLLNMICTLALLFSFSLQRKFLDTVLGTRILNFTILALIFSRITYGSQKFQFKWCGIKTYLSTAEEAWGADSHLPHYAISAWERTAILKCSGVVIGDGGAYGQTGILKLEY